MSKRYSKSVREASNRYGIPLEFYDMTTEEFLESEARQHRKVRSPMEWPGRVCPRLSRRPVGDNSLGEREDL